MNRQYSNIVLIHYEIGSGGKFLLNCLGLSDDAVFYSAALAEKQLQGNFTLNDKINYLNHYLNEAKITKIWNDFGLGCYNMYEFTHDQTKYKDDFEEGTEILNDLHSSSIPFADMKHKFHKVFTPLTTSNPKVIFFISHSKKLTLKYLAHFPNIKIIQFDNYGCWPFRKIKKNTQLASSWENIKGLDWPKKPPLSINEYNQLSDRIRKEVKEKFNNVYQKQLIENMLWDLPNLIYTWDVSWYLDETMFILKIEELYKILKLSGFDNTVILDFYKQWINTLSYLKDK